MAQESLYSIAETLYSNALTNILDTATNRYETQPLSTLCTLTDRQTNDYSIGVAVMNSTVYVTRDAPSHWLTPNDIALSDYLYQFIRATAHMYFSIDELYLTCVICITHDNLVTEHLTNSYYALNRARNLLADAVSLLDNTVLDF
jgi:hypothetical protein